MKQLKICQQQIDRCTRVVAPFLFDLMRNNAIRKIMIRKATIKDIKAIYGCQLGVDDIQCQRRILPYARFGKNVLPADRQPV